MVEEQELHDPLLRLAGDLGGVLRADLHAVAEHLRARRLRLGHALDLDEAGTAGRDRVEQRVVAETGNLDAELLRGADDERALRHLHLDTVDRHRDEVGGDLHVGAGSARTRSIRDRHRAAAPENT